MQSWRGDPEEGGQDTTAVTLRVQGLKFVGGGLGLRAQRVKGLKFVV